MKLALDRLKETPESMRLESDANWAAQWLSRFEALQPRILEDFRFTFQAQRMAENAFLDGQIQADIELGCVRCLARYRLELREPFRLLLEPAGKRRPTEQDALRSLAEDGLWLSDDLDVGWFRGKEVDLGAFFQEVATLAIPVNPTCREDCLGLCPRCGVNRNGQQCNCQQVHNPSPFAVLQQWRSRGKGNVKED